MNIPETSEVLIVGVNPASLAFAVLLGKNGLKVLVIDELPTLGEQPKNIMLDDYTVQLLQETGYDLTATPNHHYDTQNFIAGSLKLLAAHLCSVVWNVHLPKHQTTGQHTFMLQHQGEALKHQCRFMYHRPEWGDGDDLPNFRNVFLLGWRLIGVVKQSLGERILASQAEEYQLLKKQAQRQKKTAKPKPRFLKTIDKLVGKKKEGFNLIGSPISLHLSQQRTLEAGELFPNLPFYDEKLKVESHLYEWCSYEHFSIILLGYLSQPNLFGVARWLKGRYPTKLYYLPPSDANKNIFEAFNIPNEGKKTFIIRPDKYIGFLHDAIDVNIIDNYLKNLLLMNTALQKA